LLVDDEEIMIKYLARRLALRGFEVAKAASGPSALEWLAGEEAAVVILDVFMPGMDGLETLQRIKQMHPDIEVIMMTGHASEATEQAGRRLGAFNYLMKPIDLDLLVAELHRAVAHRSKSAQPARKGD
jgi:DNA-binding NtrC family response regulator